MLASRRLPHIPVSARVCAAEPRVTILSILTVGAGEQYAKLSTAIAASHDGDVLLVDAGTYTNDFAVINTKISIEGVGGQVNLVATAAPSNGKAILVTNTDVTLDRISFSGARVADGNGAGIRYQAGNLVINDCYFHDNQDGLLANANATGTITINRSEFAHNGTGDGLTHNLYVGKIAKLTVEDSYFHDAVAGHEIKSRAATTVIDHSRIFDGSIGTASYSVDLPNGGNATISNNIIEQGPKSQNPAIIHFGGEGTPYAGSSLRVENNTIINDLSSKTTRAVLNQTNAQASFTDDAVWGLSSAQLATGPLLASGTTTLTSRPTLDTSSPWNSDSTPPPSLPPVAHLPVHHSDWVKAADLLPTPAPLSARSVVANSGVPSFAAMASLGNTPAPINVGFLSEAA